MSLPIPSVASRRAIARHADQSAAHALPTATTGTRHRVTLADKR
jgi:hypothetical protein